MTRNLRRLAATEADTLRAITDYLEAKKILYLRHSPSNVVGKAGKASFRKPRPSQLGAPDLIVLRIEWMASGHPQAFKIATNVLAIEVKSPTGKLSEAQENWRERAEVVGVRYLVARRLEDVIEAMK